MRRCSIICLALYLTFAFSRTLHAAGIEAAATAEQLITSCQNENFLQIQRCLNDNLNRKWKYELAYTGKPFSAIGRLEGLRKSLIGNIFAFVAVNKYWVACKATKNSVEALSDLERDQTVMISG